METWVTTKLPTFYLKVAPEYQDCSILKKWIAISNGPR